MQITLTFFVLFGTLLIRHSHAEAQCQLQSSNDADIETIAISIDHHGITDDVTEFDVAISYTDNNIDIVDIVNSDYIIITKNPEASELHFGLNFTNFQHLDENLPQQSTNEYNIILQFTLNCDGGIEEKWQFQLPVMDTNNHDPTFAQNAFSLTLPQPIPPSFNLIELGDPIVIEDVDFSNSGVTIAISPQGELFDIATMKNPNADEKQKTYIVSLRVKEYWRLSDTTTFTLTATDTGTPPRSATAELTIAIDKDLSLPMDDYKFSKPSYSFDYSVDGNGNPSLTEMSGPIEFTEKPEASFSVVLQLSDESDFKPVYGSDQSITITPNHTTLGNQDRNVINLVLTATFNNIDNPTLDSTSETVITINLPNDGLIPKFSKPFYRAEYTVTSGSDDADNLDSEDIIVTDGDRVVITQNQDFAEYFNLEENPTTAAWVLKLVNNIPPEVLDRGNDILLQIQATSGVETAYSVVAIKLPISAQTNVPKFTKISYRGYYTGNGTEADSVSLNTGEEISIDFGGDNATLQVNIVGDFDEFFTLEQIPLSLSYELKKLKPLEPATLQSETVVVLSAQASIQGSSEMGMAEIILSLSDVNATKAVSFTQPLYTADYTVNPTGFDSLAITDEIGTSVEVTSYDIADGEFSSNFKLTCAMMKCTLEVQQNLEESTLKSKTEVLLVLVASKNGGDLATATVLITLPLKNPENHPQFSQSVYTAKYQQKRGSNNDEITSQNGDIQLISTQNEGAVEIVSGDEKGYFRLLQVSDHWELKLKDEQVELPDDEFDKPNMLLVLEAKLKDSLITSNAPLLVELVKIPSSTQLAFSKYVYVGSYVDSDPPQLTDLEEPIKLANPQGIVTISIEPTYSVYFETPDFDSATGEVKLVFKGKLPAEDLAKSVVSFFISATDTSGALSESEIVIKLPKTVVATSVQFEKSVFVGEYQKEDSSTNKPAIKFTENILLRTSDNDFNTVDVKLDDSDPVVEYFDISRADSKVSVVVKDSGLPAEILDGPDLVLTIRAIASKQNTNDSDTAAFVIKLPEKTENSTSEIYFSKTVYFGDYKVDQNEHLVNVDVIQVLPKDKLEGLSVDLDSESTKYFTATADENGLVTVESKISLPSDLLTLAVYTMEITAKTDATNDNIQASLIVRLPKNVIDKPIVFNDVVYMANYEKDGDFEVETDIKITGQNLETVNIVLRGEYHECFDAVLSVTDGVVKITRNDMNSLPKDVLDDEITLTVHIEAVQDDISERSALVVKLPKSQQGGGGSSENDDDDGAETTAFIAVIAVLAVLLIAALVGSAWFYRKMRSRGQPLIDPTEEEPVERFTKNSSASADVSKFSHPTRRATGFVSYPIKGVTDALEETQNETEPSPERRKSVVFNENVEEMEIDSTANEEEADVGQHKESESANETPQGDSATILDQSATEARSDNEKTVF